MNGEIKATIINIVDQKLVKFQTEFDAMSVQIDELSRKFAALLTPGELVPKPPALADTRRKAIYTKDKGSQPVFFHCWTDTKEYAIAVIEYQDGYVTTCAMENLQFSEWSDND